MRERKNDKLDLSGLAKAGEYNDAFALMIKAMESNVEDLQALKWAMDQQFKFDTVIMNRLADVQDQLTKMRRKLRRRTITRPHLN